MGKSDRLVAKFIPPVAIAIFFLILLRYCSFCMGFKEQTGMFFFGPGCLERYFSNPAVLSGIAGDFLTACSLTEPVAVAMGTVMLALLWWGIDRFMRLTGALGESRFLAVVPVAIECVFMAYPNYPLSSTVGLVLAVWAAVAAGSIGNGTVRTCAIASGIPLLYVALGAPVIAFAVLAALTVKRRYYVVWLAAVLLAVPVMGHFYNLSCLASFCWPAVDGYIAPSSQLITLSYLLIAVPVFLAGKEMWKPVKYAVVLASIGLVWLGKPGKDIEYSIEIGTHAYYGDWEKVREMGRQERTNRYGLYFYNLSYARDGNLPDNLLSIRQHMLSDGLFLSVSRGESYLSSFYWPMALVGMGDFAQANDAALLGQTIMPGGYSSRMMRTLSEIAVASGDYDVAKKYLDMLSRTPGYMKWADSMLQRISDNDIPEKYLVWRSRAIESDDRLFPQGDTRSALKLISEGNPMNKVAADYLMCACLLNKNINTFIGLYEHCYLDMLDRFVQVPKLYEQALLVNVNSNESLAQTATRYSISQETVDRYMDFLQDQIKANGKLSRLEKKYSDTYWYYIMSTNLVHNENE